MPEKLGIFLSKSMTEEVSSPQASGGLTLNSEGIPRFCRSRVLGLSHSQTSFCLVSTDLMMLKIYWNETIFQLYDIHKPTAIPRQSKLALANSSKLSEFTNFLIPILILNPNHIICLFLLLIVIQYKVKLATKAHEFFLFLHVVTNSAFYPLKAWQR